jgi:hypothetical protein
MNKPESITETHQNGTQYSLVDDEGEQRYPLPTEPSHTHDPERCFKEFKARHIQMMALGIELHLKRANGRRRYWLRVTFSLRESSCAGRTDRCNSRISNYGNSALFCFGMTPNFAINNM